MRFGKGCMKQSECLTATQQRLGVSKLQAWLPAKLNPFLDESTYAIIPPIAINTPSTDLSPTARPDVIQPRATIEQVFT